MERPSRKGERQARGRKSYGRLGSGRPRTPRRAASLSTHGAKRESQTKTLPWNVMIASRRRRYTAETIFSAATSAGIGSHDGSGSLAFGCHPPRLSTWRISLVTKPGEISVTVTPRGASSEWSASENARIANLLIAYGEAFGAEM